ncbi:hypothetical protein AVEN_141831-1 [Araneus ventricosus]|uniref:Uncharacterized protein n=1 Tax=Araneus ventricosus TaxID=182803 RepID=A0A4Y2KEW0_ARAVE|nr:hypothetical protein AVEN_141831-1 [Araneus ventricosus]
MRYNDANITDEMKEKTFIIASAKNPKTPTSLPQNQGPRECRKRQKPVAISAENKKLHRRDCFQVHERTIRLTPSRNLLIKPLCPSSSGGRRGHQIPLDRGIH